MDNRKPRLVSLAAALPFLGALPGFVHLLIVGGANEDGANMGGALILMFGFAAGIAAGVFLLLWKWPTGDW